MYICVTSIIDSASVSVIFLLDCGTVWYFCFVLFHFSVMITYSYSECKKAKVLSKIWLNKNIHIENRHKGSNTGKRARRKNLRLPSPRETNRNLSRGCLRFFRLALLPVFFFSLISISCTFSGVWFYFSLNIFVKCLHSIERFPRNCFPLVKLIVDLSIYIRVLEVF